MREIKFRGKRLDNGEWAIGDLEYCRAKNVARIHVYDAKGYYERQHEVDPATVGQYTGLKDGDGKEIYEGDIVYDVETINGSVYSQEYVIEYSERHCGFVGVAAQRLLIPSCFDDVKVIGNIHDNPEPLNLKTI